MLKTSSASTTTRGAIIRRSAAGLAGLAVAGAGLTALSAPATAAPVSTWDALAQCESGGNWSINTGNGYYGGLQFSQSSWQAAGGSGMPHQNSKSEQIRVAENLLAMQGWGAWPACSAKLGLYGTPSDTQVTTAPKAQEAPQQEVAPQQAPVEQAPVTEAPAQQAPVQEERTSSVAPVSPVAKSDETITVKPGDTLYKLAVAHGIEGGWQDLYAANTDTVADANLIFVGQVLHLPA